MRTWGCRLTPLGLRKGSRDEPFWTRPHHRRSQAQGSSLESAPCGQRVVGSSPDHVAKFFKIFMTRFTSSANWRFNDAIV